MAFRPEASQPQPSEPSWDDLRIFLAVVAHGSLNGAARAIGQSQPTVARRIRALEEGLGVALFRRSPNSLDLTEAGRAVLEAASPMAEAARAVPRMASAYRADPLAPVRVTATMTVTLFLSRHAANLARRTAPVEIGYLPTRRRLDLMAGEADIALRMRNLPDGEDLIARRLGRVAFAVYATSPDCRSVIVPPEDPNLSRQAALIARYAEGRAAAVLPCWLGDSDPDLVRVLEPPEEMIEDVYLVVHRRSRGRAGVARVMDALVALFRREQAALLGKA